MMREAEGTHRIEVGLKSGMRDPLGERVKRRIGSDLGLSVKSVKTISVYTLDMDLSKEQLETVCRRSMLPKPRSSIENSIRPLKRD
jgi:phosphoribosylformylglycinamidine (FGAM) synthase PurS component